MRTLILNKFLHRNGGSETYIFKLGEALEQHGHEVQYFGMEHEGRCVGNRVNAYTSDMDFHGGSKLSKLTYPIKTIYSKEARVQLRKVLDETVNGIKNIKNVGFQKGEALEKLIREARFSIYPSEWYENCPFSVMESQMYGTPVLGANIGGIPELIQVGKTGELFESGNAEDLKKKIEKLWGDKKLCAEYSANCKDISFDTIDEYYEKIMKVYQ